MTDARLRELERRWKETADPEAGAAYLRARVRAGSLGADALELASYLGDPAARAAVEAPPLEEPPPLPEWVKGLNRWGKETSVRAALAMVEEACRLRPDPALERPLELARAWVQDPSRPLPAARGSDRVGPLLQNVVAARGTLTAGIRAAALAERWLRDVRPDEPALRGAIRLALVTWLYGSAPPIEVDDWAAAQVQASVERRERDEAASQALLDRVTAGTLRQDELELLAHLNHRPARQALRLPGATDLPYDLDLWLNAIGRYGIEPLRRAAEALRGLPWLHERPIRWREGSRSWARSLIKQLDTQRANPFEVRNRVRDALVPWILGGGD